MHRGRFFTLAIAMGIVAGACSGTEVTAPSPPDTASSTTATTLAETLLEPGSTTTTATWEPTADRCSEAGAWGVCQIEDYANRPYDVYVPSSYEPNTPTPVVLVIHGGGGKAENAITTTCGDGDRDSPSCLHNIAEHEGFVAIYPNGSGFGVLPTLKTWNAGGGGDEYNCVSGQACARGVDDIAYFTALLDDLATWLNVDTGMVYATGLSNGAAMSHRLACEMSDRFTAIAAVAGANQFSTTAACDITRAVAIMQIHGTEDPCWTYEASDDACADTSGGIKVGAEESTTAWVNLLGCDSAPVTTEIPDTVEDQTSTTRTVWAGCADNTAEVHLMTITGGGHTWPGGDPYLTERIVGRVTADWDSTLIWEFLSQFDRSTDN